MTTDQADRFQWHEAARLFDGQGREQRLRRDALSADDGAGSPASLARAMANAADGFRLAGDGFRLAGDGVQTVPGSLPMLETLTGGSTGAPRRIRRTQASWIAGFAVNAGLFGIGPGARVAVLGRLVHSLALYGAVEGLHLGAAVHLLDALRPDRQARVLARAGMTHLYATPAQLRLLLLDAARPAPRLRQILVGGATLDASLRAGLARFAPQAAIREFYGAAETSFVTLADAQAPEGSVGPPYPGVSIDIRAGEIWVRSPYLFDGYASDPGSARWDGGWLSVGEMGHWHGAALVLSGRAGRMVTVADQNVFPEAIEAFLMAQPGIARAAVIARPDRLRGCVITAVVMGDAAGQAAILAACRAGLGPLRSPRALIFRPDWPVTASGKTDLAAIERGLACKPI